MLIYQIYPRSFRDANGDGIGDLKGIAEKLPYIARLGVDAVWISPFVKSPQKDFGYDVSDYRAVDPRFGTLDDFKRLLDAAHKRGLKVMMDQVWCHCSDQHAWFRESRAGRDNAKADWFIWRDAKADGSPPNNWLSYFGGPAWTWDTRRQQYYFHQFLSSQPTFNLRHAEMRRAILQIGEFWLKMGVDGFRLDAIHTGFADPKFRDNPPRPKGLPPAPDVPANIPQARQLRRHSEAHADTLPFLRDIRRLADRYGAFLLGEVNGENPHERAVQYTQKGLFHSAYNFSLLKGAPDTASFAALVLGVRGKKLALYCYTLSNHDVPRVATRWGKSGKRDEARLRQALLFGLTLPGDYCLYQGEELGLTEADVPFEKMQDPFGLAFYPDFKGRDGCRTPMPWQAKGRHAGFSAAHEAWLPLAEEHRSLAVDAQEKKKDSTLQFTRRAIAWRKSETALKGQEFILHPSRGGLVAYERVNGVVRVLCLFNFGEKTVEFAFDGAASAIFTIGATLRRNKVVLKPGGTAILHKVD
jgi:alpha-glucosidase